MVRLLGGGGGRARHRRLATLSFLAGLGVWQLLASVIVHNPLFFPTIGQVWTKFVDTASNGQLALDLKISGEEFAVGYFSAAAVAILMAGIVSMNRTLSSLSTPWVYMIYSTPSVALAPLFILWFGIGISSKIAVVVLMVFFPVYMNTRQGLEATDSSHVDVARSYNADRVQMFLKIKLPSAVPYVLVGLRLAVGRGIIAIVVGEFYGAAAGLGYRLNQASQLFDSAGLFVPVIILALLGMLGTAALSYAERRIAPWRFDD